MFVDDTEILADGATVAETSFEDDLGGWSVAGPPADSGANANDWIRTASVGFVDGPGRGHGSLDLLGLRPRGCDRSRPSAPS